MLYNPYSVSRLGTYNSCPKKFKLFYIEKIKINGEPILALERGSFSHEVLEHNFDYSIPYKLNNVFNQKEKNKTIEMLKKFEKSEMGQKVKKLISTSTLEEDFAFNKKLELVDFKDKEAWIRGSADLYFVKDTNGFIADYKTGKDKSKDVDFGYTQAMVYALYMFIKFPEVKDVKAVFIFIEHSTEKEIEFYKSNFNSYIKDLYLKTKNIEDDPFFPEAVSALCSFCDFNDTEFCSAFDDNIKRTEQILSSKISLDF